jgi:SNW domain-containing protein 1
MVEEVIEGPVLPPTPTVVIPPYGKRVGWKPKAAADFGGGGSYPEVSLSLRACELESANTADMEQCHVAQYPLDMGRKKVSLP